MGSVYVIKRCVDCPAKFLGHIASKRCPECRAAREKGPPVHVVECKGCGVLFETTKGNKKFHNRACRKEYFKRKAQKIKRLKRLKSTEESNEEV